MGVKRKLSFEEMKLNLIKNAIHFLVLLLIFVVKREMISRITRTFFGFPYGKLETRDC